eukprot:PITA_18158
MVDPTKIDVILNLQASGSVKQLHATLGHAGYYRKFIKSYAQVLTQMQQLLKKDDTYCWNEECNKSLETLKEKMASAPILVFPKWDVEFHVHVDASCIALEKVGTQEGAEGIDHPIAFASRLDHLSRINIGEEPINIEEGLPDAQLYAVHIENGHFKDIIHFLTIGTVPQGYSVQRKKELVIRAIDFIVIVGHIYKMGNDEILRRYVPKFERRQILAKAHGWVAGGHYAGRATAQKILCARLWWPTLHQDSKANCQACNVCQRRGKPLQRDEMPHQPQMML